MGMRLKPLEEQVVALMGASSGIGRGTALRFANRGAKVVVSARNEKGLNSLVEEIKDKGVQPLFVPGRNYYLGAPIGEPESRPAAYAAGGSHQRYHLLL